MIAHGSGLICRWVIGVFGLAYVGALAIFLVATFGLFSQPRDPLGGIFLIPLGLPWNLLVDKAPERLWPWLAATAPLLNIFLLAGLCRFGRNRLSRQDRL